MKGFRNTDFGNPSPPTAPCVFFVFLFFLPFVSCSSSQRRESLPYYKPSTHISRIVEILDYKDRASGAKLPEWVSLYINHGVSALEKLEGFAPYFVFVAEQSSPNLDTLLQWSGNFSHERNMTHLVLLRAYRRLTENISVNPDDMYGVFFETFIKRLASRYWPSSQKYDGVWVLVQRLPVAAPQDASASEASYQDDIEQDLPEDTEEETSGSRLYLYLILNLIEKPELQNAVQFVMNDITLDEALERDQVQAVNSIKANFFNGF